MAKKKPLKEEQGVSVLVVENRPHNGHPREGPLSHDVKHEASVLGLDAAGNRETESCQPGIGRHDISQGMACSSAAGEVAGCWYLVTPSKTASKIHWYVCMVWGVKVTVAKAWERLAMHILLGSTSKMSVMRAMIW